MYKQIADTVTEWTSYANLKFDFTDSTGNYHTWDPGDTDFKAQIRVSFDQIGYYSLVGNDSINKSVRRPARSRSIWRASTSSFRPIGRGCRCTNSGTRSASSTSTRLRAPHATSDSTMIRAT